MLHFHQKHFFFMLAWFGQHEEERHIDEIELIYFPVVHMYLAGIHWPRKYDTKDPGTFFNLFIMVSQPFGRQTQHTPDGKSNSQSWTISLVLPLMCWCFPKINKLEKMVSFPYHQVISYHLKHCENLITAVFISTVKTHAG